MIAQPTDEELREQFNRSRLWMIGWTFERAMQSEQHVKTLTCAIDARRKKLEALKHQPPPEFSLT